jgi:hypothetical protein
VLISKVIKEKNRIKHYIIISDFGAYKKTKEETIELIKTGEITNARVQEYNGRKSIRIKCCEKSMRDNGRVLILTGEKAWKKLQNSNCGTLLMVQYSPNLDWKQCILMKVEDSNVTLLDNSNLFSLTKRFIVNNPCVSSFKFGDNNTEECARLMQLIKEK